MNTNIFSRICILFLLVAASIMTPVKAQIQRAVDMALLDQSLVPAPGIYPGAMNIRFAVKTESGNQTLTNAPAPSATGALITISLNKLDASSVMPSGPGAAFFTWTYLSGTWTGTSISGLMLSGVNYYIELLNVPTTTPSNVNDVGFQANLTPPTSLRASDSSDDQLSQFTTVVLPVTLLSFDVQKEGQQAQLRWATTQETNSDYFEIQHSTTGKEWAAVGQVSSHGESTTLKSYTFSHSTPVNGENLYRLKMVDKDQTFAYSRIRSVKFEGLTEVDLSVYPNPVTDKLNIRDINGVSQINIYDLKGMSLYQSVNPKITEINVKDFAAGMYVVKIKRANGLFSSQKIVVSK